MRGEQKALAVKTGRVIEYISKRKGIELLRHGWGQKSDGEKEW